MKHVGVFYIWCLINTSCIFMLMLLKTDFMKSMWITNNKILIYVHLDCYELKWNKESIINHMHKELSTMTPDKQANRTGLYTSSPSLESVSSYVTRNIFTKCIEVANVHTWTGRLLIRKTFRAVNKGHQKITLSFIHILPTPYLEMWFTQVEFVNVASPLLPKMLCHTMCLFDK